MTSNVYVQRPVHQKSPPLYKTKCFIGGSTIVPPSRLPFHSQLTELEVFVQFHSENTTLLEASTSDNMVNTKLCCSSYTFGTVCGTRTVWGGVTNMFSAHGSCDGLFVMNELHHMVMTYFYGLWEDSLKSFEKENRKWERKKLHVLN